MILKKDEYRIDGEWLCLKRSTLEEWRNAYLASADERQDTPQEAAHYEGMAALLRDMTDLFRPSKARDELEAFLEQKEGADPQWMERE